jgi:hypothetical protein
VPRVPVVCRMLGGRSVMVSPECTWGVRWSGVNAGGLGRGCVVPGMDVRRRMRSVVAVPVMMRVRVCHSGHRTPNVSVAHFDS